MRTGYLIKKRNYQGMTALRLQAHGQEMYARLVLGLAEFVEQPSPFDPITEWDAITPPEVIDEIVGRW